MSKILLHCLGSLAALLMASGVNAAIIITAVESGGDVIFSTEAGGSLDLSGLTFDTIIAQGPIVDPSATFLATGSSQFVAIWQGATAPAPFGAGGIAVSDSSSGDLIGGDALGNIVVPSTYVAGGGGPLAGSMTFLGESFASLGMTPGSYVWSWSSDSLTLNIVAVPIPAAFWLFGSALGLLGWMRRKPA